MKIDITLRDMISAKKVDGEFDFEAHSDIWAVYFLGVEIAREPEPWSRYEGPEELLQDKYTKILGAKLIGLLGMNNE